MPTNRGATTHGDIDYTLCTAIEATGVCQQFAPVLYLLGAPTGDIRLCIPHATRLDNATSFRRGTRDLNYCMSGMTKTHIFDAYNKEIHPYPIPKEQQHD